MWSVMFDGHKIGTGETLKSVQAQAFDFIKNKVYAIDKISFKEYHNAGLTYRQLSERQRVDRNMMRWIGMCFVALIMGSLYILALILKGGF